MGIYPDKILTTGIYKCRWLHESLARQPEIRYTKWPKVCGQMPVTPMCVCSPNYCHKIWSTQLYRMYLFAVALQLPFTGIKEFETKHVSVWQYPCAQHEIHKDTVYKVGMEEVEWPVQIQWSKVWPWPNLNTFGIYRNTD